MRHILGSKLWDIYSLGYDLITASFLQDVRKGYTDKLLTPKSPDDKPDNILIIGAGTGECLKYIDPSIHVTLIDYSLQMLKRARRKVRNCENVSFHRMDAHHLDFPDSSFQRILMPLILAVAEDPALCLKEAERVLMPGGRLVVFDKFIHKGETPSLMRKALNLISSFIATKIDIDFYTLLGKNSKLTVLEENPSIFNGWFKVFLLEKKS